MVGGPCQATSSIAVFGMRFPGFYGEATLDSRPPAPATAARSAVTPGPAPVAVVLVGAHGHGRWHLRNIDRLRRAALPVRLAGVCDTRPRWVRSWL